MIVVITELAEIGREIVIIADDRILDWPGELNRLTLENEATYDAEVLCCIWRSERKGDDTHVLIPVSIGKETLVLY